MKDGIRNLLLVVMALAAGSVVWVNRAHPVVAAVAGLAVLLGGGGYVLWSYRRGPHMPLDRAQGSGRAIVLWKPGCPYCERLIRALKGDERVAWVNVWQDRAANVEVRRHNGGNELTPTALVGDRVLINPSAQELRAALDGQVTGR